MLDNRSSVGQPRQRGSTFIASDTQQAAICSGASFSIYGVRELIGVGSTASVYRAYDARLRREVALKVLNTEAFAGADGLARFLHEARMAAAVRHPNVVSIFDVGVHDGTPFIVMELLTGGDLDMRLNAARVLREPAVIDIAVQLASGLSAVHDAGVVHRGLRPSHVFLARGPDGSTQPKLLDFGLSKQTRDNLRLTTNGRRRWAAMPLYTAPEVLLDGDATYRSDQYSLGVLLYECVTGVNPFRADTLRESIDLITTGQARPIMAQPIQPSRRLAAIIEKAMHVLPEERFADVHELGHALAGLSRRRAWWQWSAGPAGPARHPGSASLARRSTQHSGPGISWALGATIIGCSIAAPLWAWYSGHRHRAAAPVSMISPLSPVEGHAAVAAPPVSSTEAAPPPAPSGAQASPPAADRAPPASNVAATTAPTAQVQAGSPAPEEAEPPAPERAEPTSVTAFAAITEVVGVADAAPHGEAPHAAVPGAAAPGDLVDSGVAQQENGAALDPGAPTDVPSPGVAAPLSGPERGTNGALIFD